MEKYLCGLVLGSFAVICACETNPPVAPAPPAAQGRAFGAPASLVGGSAAGAGSFQGAAVGAPVGGLAGAVWSDPNNTGYVTGYTFNGQYYPGAPPGYDPAAHLVVTRTMPENRILRGAVIGAPLAGLAGAVWADRNNDGIVDGYLYNGQYYPGVPPGYAGRPPPPSLAAPSSGPPASPAPVQGQGGERG